MTGLRTARAGGASARPDPGLVREVWWPWLFATAGFVMYCLALWPAPASAETIADGISAYRQGDYQRARDIWRPLAEAGDAVAQFNLGKLYEYGGGEVRQDHSQAARWYREAAAQGVTAAQNNLGLMHSQGLGVPRDRRRAAELWKRAAEDDYSLAQYNLALAYFRGEGVPRDERLAALWFEKAAQAGLPDSQYAMGQLLRLGRVAARDEGQALTWYKLAAAQGHTDAALQAQSLQGRGVVAKNPVPLERAPAPAATSAAAAAPPPEPAAEQSAATSEPSAEQPAIPAAPSVDTASTAQAAGEREATASAEPEESADAGVAVVVPVPEPKPDPPAEAAPPEADTAGQQTAALPAPEAESDEAPEVPEVPEVAVSVTGGEQETGPATIYRLWLVSADSAVAAEGLLDETLARHSDALGGVEVDIYEMDYGERGHFYRILAGPLHSADAANELCRRLREDNPQEFCKVLTR